MAGVSTSSPFADDRIPSPRVKGFEARNIYNKHQGTVQNIMLEVQGTSVFDHPKSSYSEH